MTLTIASFTNAETDYRVDLHGLTCDCKDWVNRRSQEPMDSEKRLCKHLKAAKEAVALTLKAKAAQVKDADLPRLIEKYQDDAAILEALLDERERRLETALKNQPAPQRDWAAFDREQAELKALFA